MQQREQSISLQLTAEVRFIQLVQGVVENAALAFGLERGKALKLTMAAEEVVSHLAATAGGTEIRLTISTGGWCVTADFAFIADPSDLWAVNLAAMEDIGGGKSMDHMGLLLASRMADGFAVRLEGKVVHLEIRQDHSYPVITPEPRTLGTAKGAITILPSPEPALLKEACAQVLGLYPAHLVHEAFHRPGKVVDMVAQGALDLAVATDATGALAGMISWRSPSASSVSFSGPYVFVDDTSVAAELETHLLNTVARTNAISLFSDLATNELVTQNFEALGKLHFIQANASSADLTIWFRHLREDSGVAIWAHPVLRHFLEQAYDNLVLMRTIRDTDVSGETLPDRTVLSARLRPELLEASLSPMVVGADVSEVIARHVRMLIADDYRNIFFHLDLAYGWQAALGGPLMDNGFVPKLVLPHGGTSDVVVFQHG